MADKKIFQVVDGPIGIRMEPNGQLVGLQLKQSDQIEVIDDSVDKDGYIWVKHNKGWSAVSNSDGDEVFMLDISSRPTDAPRVFRVWAQNISIRDSPNGKRLAGKLFRKMEINVDPTSRSEAGWLHLVET